MATDKKGFILYADQKELFEQLSDEKAGQLMKFIFAYVNDENPVTDDLLVNLAFTPIKQQFKRDLKKWENTREGRSKAGKASAEARKKNKIQQELTKPTSVNKSQQSSTNSTVNDNVNVNVNVKDKVIVSNTIHSRKLTFSQSTSKLFDSEFPNDKHHLDDFVEYWTEHGDKDKKMRFEKEKSFSTSRRVKTWIKNNFNNNNHGDKQQNKQTAISIGLNNPNL